MTFEAVFGGREVRSPSGAAAEALAEGWRGRRSRDGDAQPLSEGRTALLLPVSMKLRMQSVMETLML